MNITFPGMVEIHPGTKVLCIDRDKILLRSEGKHSSSETRYPGDSNFQVYIALLSPQLLGCVGDTRPGRRAEWAFELPYHHAKRFFRKRVIPLVEQVKAGKPVSKASIVEFSHNDLRGLFYFDPKTMSLKVHYPGMTGLDCDIDSDYGTCKAMYDLLNLCDLDGARSEVIQHIIRHSTEGGETHAEEEVAQAKA